MRNARGRWAVATVTGVVCWCSGSERRCGSPAPTWRRHEVELGSWVQCASAPAWGC
jgi:hypothetical protein